MEHDYRKRDDLEFRYRSLFEAISDPLLLIDSENLSVIEANPAAIAVLGFDNGDSKGMLTHGILESVATNDRELVAVALKRAREIGGAPGIQVSIGCHAEPYVLLARRLEQEKTGLLLVHLMSIDEAPSRVEISAILKSNPLQAFIAMYIHDVGRRLETSGQSELLVFLSGMAGRLGEAPLKEVVSSAVGLVERYYIEAALEAVDGNRTAAARILGVSRQGFYDKLTRYRINKPRDYS